MAFTSTYGQLSPIIPYVITAPFYFAGRIQLGVMTQTASAFGRVESALTFFINYYTSLANFKSVLDRSTSFDEAIDTARATDAARRSSLRRDGADIRLRGLTLALPDGRHIVTVDDLDARRRPVGAAHRPVGLRQVDAVPRHRRHLALRFGRGR